ncbi:SIMPL domain-containing protein [Falsirhodobacter halotolerans]|uniref:SIMPL domain-containing protein n=1 Tax=Falsirhodobacter halotolerans TaxID=1146892 RepID=UPI001FD0B4F8|nr:SIMPL domain-containing protein [Falsirhodobacter halotolerans]MCJ8140329.1 SIMPL domain-containing protein [Falsirhodobacter halotolerans]
MKLLKACVLGTALTLPMAALADGKIEVTGQGQVSIAPDMATVTLGVTSQGDTAQAAMEANAAELTRVMERLTGAGIAEADVQTTGLQLNPNWAEGENQARRIDGYTAENMVTVKVRQLDGLGGVLDAAVADGANTLNGIAFDLADPKPAMDEARKRAVADAVERAQLMTEAAGVRLGNIERISEGGNVSVPMPMYRMAAEAASTPVSAGEITRDAQVTIVFEIDEMKREGGPGN